MRRLNVFMAEPQRDDGNIDSRLQQMHGTGVATIPGPE
jgi:hypothetical protein